MPLPVNVTALLQTRNELWPLDWRSSTPVLLIVPNKVAFPLSTMVIVPARVKAPEVKPLRAGFCPTTVVMEPPAALVKVPP